MSSNRFRKTLTTAAAVLGTGLGAYGIALQDPIRMARTTTRSTTTDLDSLQFTPGGSTDSRR